MRQGRQPENEEQADPWENETLNRIRCPAQCKARGSELSLWTVSRYWRFLSKVAWPTQQGSLWQLQLCPGPPFFPAPISSKSHPLEMAVETGRWRMWWQREAHKSPSMSNHNHTCFHVSHTFPHTEEQLSHTLHSGASLITSQQHPPVTGKHRVLGNRWWGKHCSPLLVGWKHQGQELCLKIPF